MNDELLKRFLSSVIILPVALFVIIKGSFYFSILLLLCLFISVYEWNKMKISKLFKTLGIIFLVVSFYTIFSIRTNFENNYWPFLIICFICISTDLGGYFFGKIFKGPKLTVLSPNKTYAGVIGSFLFCLLLYYILLINYLVNEEYYFKFLIFIFLISSMSQLGDILISYFKRLSKIKDTGNIIPGHGGLLDRIDGMIFAFPLSYLLLLFDHSYLLI